MNDLSSQQQKPTKHLHPFLSSSSEHPPPQQQQHPSSSSLTPLEKLQAGAFRSLVQHLQHYSNDIANIDLMTLAGFCRNCLAKVRTLEVSDPTPLCVTI